MFMHHDIAVLEQVSLHKLQTTKHFVRVFIFGTCSLSKAFRKDPLELDVEEAINSNIDSDEEERDGTAEHKEDDTPLGKEVDTAGIVINLVLLLFQQNSIKLFLTK